MKKYLAFDIGCIDCGEDSRVIGVYSKEEEAIDACNIAEKSQEEEWKGQHSFEVFEIDIK